MITEGEAAALADLSWLRRPRSVLFVAQLLVSLPFVVVTILLLGWLDRKLGWPQWILPAAWLIWCVTVRYRPVRVRFVSRMRSPTSDEAALLVPAWETVARAAGVDTAKYPLVVQGKPLRRGLIFRPRAMIVVHSAGLTEAAQRDLSAQCAWGLGLHLIGPSYARRLTALYRRPALLATGIAAAVVTVVIIVGTAVFMTARGKTDFKGDMSNFVYVGAQIVAYGTTAGVLLPVLGLPGAVVVTVACALDSYGKEFLGLYSAIVADRVAVCLGYGRELRDYLAAHPDRDRFRRSLPWSRGRLWYLERRMSTETVG
ncbi:hypothetical protein ACIBCN_06255 [Nocardia sp. NPDC051052]|uniref:hypothetical protein n=1 Tax=Nocardia sp. NPDC051052 TaxID=3364322 RepID=UPI0037A8AD38